MQRPTHNPCSPQPTMPTVRASSRPSSWVATAAAAPVRNAVTARASSIASGSPSSAFETSTTPVTVGSPRRGFAGKDVTHLRIARPSPRAGIARKSPFGGLGR